LPEELIGRKARDFIHPEDESRVAAAAQHAIETGDPEIGEYRHLTKDGSYVWVEATARVIAGSRMDGPNDLVCVVRDISERKQVEDENRRLAELLDHVPSSITVHDFDGRFLYANQRTLEMHGYSRDEFLAVNLRQLDVPESAALIASRMREVSEKGQAVFEAAHFRKDGTTVPLQVYVRLARWGDLPIHLSVATDITERKRAQEEIEKLAKFPSEDPNPVLRIARDGVLLYINEAGSNCIGDSPLQVGRAAPRMFSEAVRRSMDEGTPQAIEIEHRGRVYSFFVAPVVNEGYTNLYGRDITASVRAQEVLRASEERFRALFETIPGIVVVHKGGCLQDVNAATERATGYTRDELREKPFWELVHPDFHGLVRAHWEARRRGDVAPSPYEFKIVTKAGEERWVIAAAALLHSGGEPAVLGTMIDVTDLKEAEAAAEREHRLLSTLLEAIPDYIYVKDPENRFLLNNRAHLLLLGAATQGEVAGKTDDDIFSPELAARYRNDDQAVMRSGHPLFNREERTRDREGNEQWVLTTKVPFRDSQGRISGIVGISRDITERKRVQEALAEHQRLLQSLASDLVQSEDRERRHIAAYLHDEVGQSLAAVRVKFATWKRMKSSPKRDRLLADIEQLIDKTIEETRTLTFDLSPPILFELGLGPALEWLGETLFDKEGIAFEFRDDGHSGKIEEALASALYRIVRELLANVLKHARARHVAVAVSGGDSGIRLVVKDDGAGMEHSRYEQALKGAGGTYGLISVHERLRHLGGSLEIESDPGKGTRVTVAAPFSHKV
jgi:PAS domain S-box-containing protein